MKKHLKIVACALMATVMIACNNNDKSFKTTEGGLMYKFEVLNKDAQPLNEGDVIVGELTVRFDTMVLFSNVGHPERIMQLRRSNFRGDLNEGLAMLHVGDKAVFAVPADTIAQYLGREQMPQGFKDSVGQFFYYEVNVMDVVTLEELEKEQQNTLDEYSLMQESEPEQIAAYIAENNIKVKPNADGLYIIEKKRGNGPKVAVGKQVAINYTGRLLDGTMFDSSVEQDAQEGGIYDPRREYSPLTYKVGQMSLIKGWEDGIMGKTAGSVLQLIIPSSLGYGAQGAGNIIPPYSPLVFDIEIVSVN